MNIVKADSQDDFEKLYEMLQIYEAEFSLITKKQPDETGIYKLDVNLNETDNFLLFKNHTVVGFCVKGVTSNRHDIYEFYIEPEYRGNKLGREFAKEIFKKYNGEWQVRQIEGANKAISFWRKAIGEFTRDNFEESVVEDKYWGKVTRQLFKSN